jgi:hypothetical protein
VPRSMVDQPPSVAIELTGDGAHGRLRAWKLTAGILGGRGRRGSPHHGVGRSGELGIWLAMTMNDGGRSSSMGERYGRRWNEPMRGMEAVVNWCVHGRFLLGRGGQLRWLRWGDGVGRWWL